jgi:hypothetical protein
VEGEDFVRCHTGLTVLMDTACDYLTLRLLLHIHPMAPSMVQAVGDFRGVEVEEEFLVAGEGSVVGGNAWGQRWNPGGSTETFFPKVDPLSPY